MAERAARSTCTILLHGETGAGKGHFAKWLHERSPRADMPFIPVNCGAIPDTLIDSQLFGHVRGAFSGATTDHLGLVRAASGGTLFLDEVGELPPSAQTRLLRLLQDREVQPVGASRPVGVDIRVIAASNSDLPQAVAERRFREDLLFRLDVVALVVPPLRERREEIPALIDGFNAEFARLYGQAPLIIAVDALDALQRHEWPGNIRQLRTVLERLHVLAPQELVTVASLEEIGQLTFGEIRPRAINALRNDEVERVLSATGGSISETAAAFGVHRSTIYRWLRHRGILAQEGEASAPSELPR